MTRIVRKQSGFTLIEVMVALLVFIIASMALITSVTSLFANNAYTKAMIDVDSLSRNFDSVIKTNPSLLSQALNGLEMAKGSKVNIEPIDNWWITAQEINPFIEKASIKTQPSSCQQSHPCLVNLSLTVKLPSRKEATRFYLLQENF